MIKYNKIFILLTIISSICLYSDIELSNIFLNVVTVSGLVNKHSKKVSLKSSNTHNYDPKNISYPFIDFRYSYMFPLIMSRLDINQIMDSNSLTQVFFAIFVLSLIALLCFLNIVFNMLVYYIIQKGNYEEKYPRLKPFINFYKNTNIIYMSIEIFICLICLLALVVFSLLYVYSGITNT
jgi:hypothetical protein